MNTKLIASLADSENDTLMQAHVLLSEILESYFSFCGDESRKRACESICYNADYIAAVLNVVDYMIFTYARDMDAALGIETDAVRTFVRNTREIYGAFLDKSDEEKPPADDFVEKPAGKSVKD